MDESEIEELARTWVEYHLLPKNERTGDNPLFSAWKRLDDLARKAPEDAWVIIMAIRKLDSSDLILSNLAAGPLEDLMVRHGEKFIVRVEILARQDEEFLYLLTGVWGWSGMPKDLWARICAVTEKSKRHM